MSDDSELTVAGRVFACLIDGELTVVLHPGIGMGGEPHSIVPMRFVDFDARLPNTDVWVTINRSQYPWCITHVRRRISN
jgi:hypothetical protein